MKQMKYSIKNKNIFKAAFIKNFNKDTTTIYT